VRELMQDQFISEILPFVSQLNGMQMSSILTQVRSFDGAAEENGVEQQLSGF
jgi:hypothetical protein